MENTTQIQAIRRFGEEICHVVKYWKPAIPVNRCPFCGRKFYHMILHVSECSENPRG